MKPDIQYPYMPEGRELKYVPADNEFMQAAKVAREECSGDPVYPVGDVLVKDGKVVARAGNGFNRGRVTSAHICPRIVLGCPTGIGHELCYEHEPPGHAEAMLVRVAQEAGIDTRGADVYMYGHWWACELCWKVLIDAGIRDLYTVDDAHERFSRDVVYAETLTPTVKTAYIAGAITNVPADEFKTQMALYEAFGEVCSAFGITFAIPHVHNKENQQEVRDAKEVYRWSVDAAKNSDVTIAEVSYPSLGTGGEIEAAGMAGKSVILLSRKGNRVSNYTKGHPSVVYHIEYESPEEACRMLSNVLKQL